MADALQSASILILYSQIEAVTRGEPMDIVSAQENALVAHEIGASLRALGYRVAEVGVVDDVAAALAPFSPAEWTVFNLCESPCGDPALEPTVPPILEAQGFAYTGSPGPTIALCLDKVQAKERLLAHGVATPRYAVLPSPDDPCSVPLPALVKPVAEDASLGITTDSVVCDAPSLARQVAYVVDRYQQPALVEEFIGGREFNLGVWSNEPPEGLPVSEISYRGFDDPLQRLLTYEAKWMEESAAYKQTVAVCPARVGAALRQRLLQTAVRAYTVVGCRDYARVDIRERDGVPFVLEVNPNPSLASDAGFCRAAQAAGFDQAHMAERIVSFALARARVYI